MAPDSSRTAIRVDPEGDELSSHHQRLAEILGYATEVFCDKGYAAASMRDLSRATGMSLAGLYYYFESKEKLLYLIQKHTFQTILRGATQRLEGSRDPKERIRLFVQNHLDYSVAHPKAMKVLSHEDSVLGDEFGQEIRAIKRQYYELCRELVEQLKQERKLEISTRLAVLSLFGMMNWIYTWHNPKADGGATELGQHMADLFLCGVMGRRRRETIFATVKRGAAPKRRRTASAKS